jgi:FSR family fosmidomycin resistance protein-like MFS transporter
VLLAIEFLDELVFGAREAAWPLIRADLHLSYVQVGIVLTIPNVVSALVEPPLALLGDAGYRRRIVLCGGVTFAGALMAMALAGTAGVLLGASIVLALASGAFVSLSQATLMDLRPQEHERSMARWTLAGAVGVLAGPVAIAGAAASGMGWRAPLVGMGVATVVFVAAAWLVRFPAGVAPVEIAHVARRAFRELRRGSVIRWLILLELTDLVGDVLFGFLALYFVDVAGARPAVAGVAVVVWAVAGLIGDWALLRVLARMDGLAYLRKSAAAVTVLYPVFLVVPGVGTKMAALAALGLLRAGWYAIPQGRLFSELPGAAGTAVALSDLAGGLGRSLPLAVGALAERFGLGVALWLGMAAPVALLAGLPRAGSRR